MTPEQIADRLDLHARRGSVNADNPNYSCGVTIAEALEAAQIIRQAELRIAALEAEIGLTHERLDELDECIPLSELVPRLVNGAYSRIAALEEELREALDGWMKRLINAPQATVDPVGELAAHARLRALLRPEAKGRVR